MQAQNYFFILKILKSKNHFGQNLYKTLANFLHRRTANYLKYTLSKI